MKGRLLRYYLLALAAVLLVCAYPIYMGASVIVRMARDGGVPVEEYPKYVIPYTPIALALVLGTALMPLFFRALKKYALPGGGALSLAVFFIAERLMETKILVLATKAAVTLESWQMSMCYVPPDMFETRPWQAVDVLLGGYSPAFKLHFYAVSVIIILSLLRGVYGFYDIILTGDKSRRRALIIQTAAGVGFLGMCVWACFTAFYRTGDLFVSPLSAVLMVIFFILMGVTAGMFTASLTLGKHWLLSAALPALTACLTVALMYAGELALLSGFLYRFGRGAFFRGLGRLPLSPADICVILAAGAITAAVCGRGIRSAEFGVRS